MFVSGYLLNSDVFITLTHFNPVLHFYYPWKRQKTFGFLIFQGV